MSGVPDTNEFYESENENEEPTEWDDENGPQENENEIDLENEQDPEQSSNESNANTISADNDAMSVNDEFDDLNRTEEDGSIDLPDDTNLESRHTNLMQESSIPAKKSPGMGYFEGIYDDMDETGSGDEYATTTQDETLSALSGFFFAKLTDFILHCGGDINHLKGWCAQVFRRRGGATGGSIDVVYINNRLKRFKSRTEVAVALGLIPYARNFVTMTKEQLHDLAKENRQKNLLSQLLFAYANLCEGIVELEGGDVLAFTSKSKTSTSTNVGIETKSIIPSTDEMTTNNHMSSIQTSTDTTNSTSTELKDDVTILNNSTYFGYGNTTVINWGKINTEPGYHTVNQLFPVGFKCIRQEYDIALDKVVDCYCEIISMPSSSSSSSSSRNKSITNNDIDKDHNSTAIAATAADTTTTTTTTNNDIDPTTSSATSVNAVTTATSTIPLFRITVGWELPNGKTVTKVYEGNSPKQVWTSIQSETIGLDMITSSSSNMDGGGIGKKSETATTGGGGGSPSSAASDTTVEAFITVTDEITPDEEKDTTDFEEFDEEEINLRKEILELRKRINREQNIEKQQSIASNKIDNISKTTSSSFSSTTSSMTTSSPKDRLTLGLSIPAPGVVLQPMTKEELEGSMELFIDPGLHRIVEGMNDVIHCTRYSFADSRQKDGNHTREGGRKALAKYLNLMHGKMRIVDKLIRKQNMMYKVMPMREVKRKKRLEDLEARRRVKQEQKDTRVVRQAIINQRKQKLKDLEKNIRIMRENIMRDYTRRRSEARMRAEIVCDKEAAIEQLRQKQNIQLQQQQQQYQGQDKGHNSLDVNAMRIRRNLPDPPNGPVGLPGDSFGQLLEIWGIMTTFPTALGVSSVPSVTKMVEAIRAVDPLLQYSTGIKHSPKALASYRELLDGLGTALCQPIVTEFKKAMSMDIAEPYLGPCNIPLTTLTWREIARIVLLSSYCRERLGWSDADVSAHIRGRGHTTAPDGADRRSLKVLRRRFMYKHWAIEKRLNPALIDQESDPYLLVPPPVAGFSSGVRIRVPAPLAQPMNRRYNIKEILNAIVYEVPDCSTWRVKELIRTAINIMEEEEYNDDDNDDEDSSVTDISNKIFSTLYEIQSSYESSTLSATSTSTSSFSMKECKDTVRMLLEGDVKTLFSLKNKKNKLDIIPIKDEDSMSSIDKNIDNSDNNVNGNGENAMDVDVAVKTKNGNENNNFNDNVNKIETMSRMIKNEDDVTTASSTTTGGEIITTSTPEAKVEVEVDSKMIIDSDVEIPSQQQQRVGNKKIRTESDYIGEEEIHLSTAIQRCYRVLKELMAHALAPQFYLPIEAPSNPILNSATATTTTTIATTTVSSLYASNQMVTTSGLGIGLSDIMQGLLEGLYKDSLTAFYRDIMGVLSDPVSFAPEVSSLAQNGLKLAAVFERLFTEGVMCITSSRSSNVSGNGSDSTTTTTTNDISGGGGCEGGDGALCNFRYCHACRKSEDGDGDLKKGVLCDRCDGPFHLECARPQLAVAPRGEWYCQYCIIQRSSLELHPLRSLKLRHPDMNFQSQVQVEGQVISVRRRPKHETLKYLESPAVQFIVEFKIQQQKTNIIISRKEIWTGEDVRRHAIDPLPILPSGYSWHDIDIITGLSYGYEGWGWTWSSLVDWARNETDDPLSLDIGLGGHALKRRRDDDVSQVIQLLDNDLITAEQWIDTLQTIAWKCMTMNNMLECAGKMDDECAAAISNGAESISLTENQFDVLNKKLEVSIGEKIQLINSNQSLGCVSNNDEALRASKRKKTDSSLLTTDDDNNDDQMKNIDDDDIDDNGIDHDQQQQQHNNSNNVLDDTESEQEIEFDDEDTVDMSVEVEDQDEDATEDNWDDFGNSDPLLTSNIKENNNSKDDIEVSNIETSHVEVDVDDASSTDSQGSSDISCGNLSFECESIDDRDFIVLVREPDMKRKYVRQEPNPLESIFEMSMDVANKLYKEYTTIATATSTTTSTSTKKRLPIISDEIWEQFHSSRSKGREDAILSHLLIDQASQFLAIDEDLDEEEIFQFAQNIGSMSAFHTILKHCTPKPSDTNPIEWYTAWQAKMNEIYQKHQTEIENHVSASISATSSYNSSYTTNIKLEPVCAFCGFTEKMLVSQFVKGQTLSEWEAEQQYDSNYNLHMNNDDHNQQQQLQSYEHTSTITTSTTIGATSTSISNDNNNNNVHLYEEEKEYLKSRRGRIWIPVDTYSSNIEIKACGAYSHLIHTGSLVVHECCAEHMNKLRLAFNTRSLKTNEQRVLDAMVGIGKGKIFPLGTDTNDNMYWVFPGSKNLFISSGKKNIHDRFTKITQMEIDLNGIESEYSLLNRKNESDSTWRIYENEQQILSVIKWLNDNISFEKTLKQILLKLFPMVNVLIEKESDRVTDEMSIIKENDSEQHHFQNNNIPAIDSQNIPKDTTIIDGNSNNNNSNYNNELRNTVKSLSSVDQHQHQHQLEASRSEDIQNSIDLAQEQENIERRSKRVRRTAPTGSPWKKSLPSTSTSGYLSNKMNENDDHNYANNIIIRRRNTRNLYKNTDNNNYNTTTTEVEDETLSELDFEESLLPPSAPRPLLSLNCHINTFEIGDQALLLDDDNIDMLSDNSNNKRNNNGNDDDIRTILWNVEIIQKNTKRLLLENKSESKHSSYYIKYIGWPSSYNIWVDEECLYTIDEHNLIQQELSRRRYIRKIYKAPIQLQSLQAVRFYNKPWRHRTIEKGSPITPTDFSLATDPLNILRAGLYLVEMAIPLGAMEDSEERWGNEFSVAWRSALTAADSPCSLMECQILLEYGIRTSWLHPFGAKLLTCMPSRIHCLRNATYGLIAMRLWALDQGIRYDKIQYPDESMNMAKKGNKASTSKVSNKKTSGGGSKSIGKKKR